MFDFPHVIEDGTPEEIKECLLLTLAAVPFAPMPVVNMRLVSAPVYANQRRLAANWAAEWDRMAHVVYDRNAERVMVSALTELMDRGMSVDERRLRQLRAELESPVSKRQIQGRIRRAFFGKRKRTA